MTVDELLEGVRAELAIKLFGDDLDVLKAKADEIAAVVAGSGVRPTSRPTRSRGRRSS